MADTISVGTLVNSIKPTTPLQMIAADDAGGIAALAFSAPDARVGRTIEIVGDELTMVETGAIFSERLGRPVTYTQQLRVPGSTEETRRMAAWFDESGYAADIPAVRAIYPPLKNMRTFVAEAEWLGG
jgi:uncharacterized protein YbjT (DUF2867 family)